MSCRLWIPCPLCYRWMKWSAKAGGYECTPCSEAARAAGWREDGQLTFTLGDR